MSSAVRKKTQLIASFIIYLIGPQKKKLFLFHIFRISDDPTMTVNMSFAMTLDKVAN